MLAVVAFSFGIVTAVASEIPQLDPARNRPQVDSVLYASNGYSVLAVLRGAESRVLVENGDISPIMKQAIVAVEDKRFYEHNGVDVRGIGRALWQDIRSQGIVEGGSTITQQFVKNAYVRNEQTIARKVREAALALAARAALVEGANPHRLPQHDLLRQRGVRDPAGGARLLRQEGVRADAAGGGIAGRDPDRPVAVRPGAASRHGARAAVVRARAAGGAGKDHCG